MAVGKLQKYRENRESELVIEYTEFSSSRREKPKGRWNRIFGNDHPVVLELACGRGDYAVALAKRFPGKNFIGIDIKGSRLWAGARRAAGESNDNVRFLRIFIDHLTDYFAPGEVSEIWITFPDPFPKKRHTKKRLTSPGFLDLYRSVLAPGSHLHLKTDAGSLFEYTIEILAQEKAEILRRVDDLYLEAPEDPLLTIQTTYEKRHLGEGRRIKYLCFTLYGETGQTAVRRTE